MFYAAYCIGGYALISWLGVAACCGAVASLLRRGSAVTAGLAIIAVPVIAMRTAPRADMFSVVLFAAFVSLLWENYRTGRARLWWLPLLMLLWVNLHLGFVAGLALIAAYIGVEFLEMVCGADRRNAAMHRLRHAYGWLACVFAVTLINPWGWGIYRALLRQQRANQQQQFWIVEWAGIPLNWTVISSNLSLRQTPREAIYGTLYVLLAIAILAALIALLRRQYGAAILLLAASYEAVRHVRMGAIFACVVVVVAGSILSSEVQPIRVWIPNPRFRSTVATAVVAMFAALVLFRSVDIVTNHRHQYFNFGVGLSYWFPERAAQFIERENPPGEIFNTYDEGGYFVWRLGPKYRDYIDGRAIPFGIALMQREQQLLASSPDSSLWLEEADRYNINTIVLPLARFASGLGPLKTFCASAAWQPVYMDEVSIVLVRHTPETADLIRRSSLDCSTAPLPVAPLAQSAAAAFTQWADAATVLAALGRNPDALAAAKQAASIVPDSHFVPWLRGTIFQAMGRRSAAELQYLTAISREPGEGLYWNSLASLYKEDGRIPDTAYALRHAIDLSPAPHPYELAQLAHLYLDNKQPRLALQAFDEAVRSARPDILAASGARSFKYDVALGRAAAWRQLGDTNRAAAFDQEAVRDLFPQP